MKGTLILGSTTERAFWDAAFLAALPTVPPGIVDTLIRSKAAPVDPDRLVAGFAAAIADEAVRMRRERNLGEG